MLRYIFDPDLSLLQRLYYFSSYIVQFALQNEKHCHSSAECHLDNCLSTSQHAQMELCVHCPQTQIDWPCGTSSFLWFTVQHVKPVSVFSSDLSCTAKYISGYCSSTSLSVCHYLPSFHLQIFSSSCGNFCLWHLSLCTCILIRLMWRKRSLTVVIQDRWFIICAHLLHTFYVIVWGTTGFRVWHHLALGFHLPRFYNFLHGLMRINFPSLEWCTRT